MGFEFFFHLSGRLPLNVESKPHHHISNIVRLSMVIVMLLFQYQMSCTSLLSLTRTTLPYIEFVTAVLLCVAVIQQSIVSSECLGPNIYTPLPPSFLPSFCYPTTASTTSSTKATNQTHTHSSPVSHSSQLTTESQSKHERTQPQEQLLVRAFGWFAILHTQSPGHHGTSAKPSTGPAPLVHTAMLNS